MSEKAERLRRQILELTAEYHAEAVSARESVAGTDSLMVFAVN